MKTIRQQLGVGILLVWSCLAAIPSEAAEMEAVYWNTVRDQVQADALRSPNGLIDLVKKAGTPPKTDSERLYALGIYFHADMPGEAEAMLEKATLGTNSLREFFRDACDYQEWQLARRSIELNGGRYDAVEEFSLDALLSHLQLTGWTFEKIDAWLASLPPNRHGTWTKQRVLFAHRQGKDDPILKEITDYIRAHPYDESMPIVYLDALKLSCGDTGQYYRNGDFAWLVKAVKNKSALQAYYTGDRIMRLGDHDSAIPFFEHATSLPISDREVGEYGSQNQTRMPGPDGERNRFFYRAHTELADCLLERGRAKEAQLYVVAAAELGQKLGFKPQDYLLFRLREALGESAVTSNAPAAKPALDPGPTGSADDPEYWLKCAEFFHWHKQPEKEEDALKKGLALTHAIEGSGMEGKGYRGTVHYRLLVAYSNFLSNHRRETEQVLLLREVLEKAPADSDSAEYAAPPLARHRPIEPMEPLLWKWIEGRDKWTWRERSVLTGLLQVQNPHFEESLKRAQSLVANQHFSRASVIGEVLLEQKAGTRALPFLRQAFDQSPKEAAEAARGLFEIYVEAGDWRKAEEVFPTAARALYPPSEALKWRERLVTAALKAGDKKDALRLWRSVALTNLNATGSVDSLVQAGLKEEVIAFYKEVQKALPTSAVPPRMLKRLASS